MAFQIPGNDPGRSGDDRGGGGDTSGPMRVLPPAPRDVKAKVDAIGKFTVTWRDYSARDWPYNFAFSWLVRYCSASLAGIPEEHPENPLYSWPLNVLALSKHVGMIGATGGGEVMSISHVEDLPDGYIMVVGSTGSYMGPPSYPLFIRLTANGNVIPDVGIVDPLTLLVFKERLPYDCLRLEGRYNIVLPTSLHEFAGVHLHVTDYNGATQPRELGPMARWDGSNGIVKFVYRLPIEQGLGEGTAAFTSGSNIVTWISGDVFSGAWVGRTIIVDEPNLSESYQISSVAYPTLNMNATVDVLVPSGTYSWKVLSNSTWYFVPIGKSGARVGDYSTAASLSL